MNDNGYLVLTDFGLSKMLDGEECTQSQVGTVDFLAPEVINGMKYTYPVDWWSLGCLSYNLLYGKPPFWNMNNDQTAMFIKIKTGEPPYPRLEKINGKKVKINISDECKDFVQKLLDKDPSTRLGSQGGIEEIFAHPWMNIDIDSIRNKTMDAPMRPDLLDILE